MSPELTVRRAVAEAALADFGRWERGDTIRGDWRTWAFRLARAFGDLLAWIEIEPKRRLTLVSADTAASHVRPDGSAVLTAPDLLTVLGALSDAAEHLAADLWEDCPACDRTGVTCPDHLPLTERLARYRALSRALGDDR
jgi:hypothetical protein